MKKDEMHEMLDQIFRQAQMQFGRAIKGRWLHDGEGCPGCGGKINVVKFKKKKALSLNAFIFREYGVLIAYLLCNRCANHIFSETKTNPYSQLPIHNEIEKNLKQAYVKHLGH